MPSFIFFARIFTFSQNWGCWFQISNISVFQNSVWRCPNKVSLVQVCKDFYFCMNLRVDGLKNTKIRENNLFETLHLDKFDYVDFKYDNSFFNKTFLVQNFKSLFAFILANLNRLILNLVFQIFSLEIPKVISSTKFKVFFFTWNLILLAEKHNSFSKKAYSCEVLNYLHYWKYPKNIVESENIELNSTIPDLGIILMFESVKLI